MKGCVYVYNNFYVATVVLLVQFICQWFRICTWFLFTVAEFVDMKSKLKITSCRKCKHYQILFWDTCCDPVKPVTTECYMQTLVIQTLFLLHECLKFRIVWKAVDCHSNIYDRLSNMLRVLRAVRWALELQNLVTGCILFAECVFPFRSAMKMKKNSNF